MKDVPPRPEPSTDLLWTHAPTGLYRVRPDGQLAAANARWLDLHGLRDDAAAGDAWLSAVHPDERAEVAAAWAALTALGRPFDRRYRVLHADGRVGLVHSRTRVLHGPAGEHLGWAGSAEDMSELAQRHEELQREQSLRLQLERHAHDLNTVLHERSEMLNVLAHEVRQPLNNASAALQNAARNLGSPGDPQASEPLMRAQRVLGQVMAGVDNALAVASLVARNGEAVMAESDVDLLIQIAVADMAAPDRERVRVLRETPSRTLLLDPSLSRLALRNLLANALALSPPHASVTVRLSDAPEGLYLDVIDEGPGVDEAVLPRLFQRGARGPAHERRGSHGLGLYIVRRAMELQGGRATLLATGPQGSVFRLEWVESDAPT